MRRASYLRASAVLLAACGAVTARAPGATCAAEDGGPVLAYRTESWDSAAPGDAGRAALTADVVARRCKHMGFDGVTAETEKDGGRVLVRVPKALAADLPEIRHVIERRGDVEFRIRATGPMEDEYRDRRLQAGAEPPPGFAWRVEDGNVLQVLVAVPEAPLAAKVAAAAAKEPKDDAQRAEVAAAEAELARVRAESVFTNSDIGAASVRRSMGTLGGQALRHVDVQFEMKEDRKAAFEKFTGANVGRTLCVLVEGKVHVAPVLKSALPGAGLLRAPGTGYTEGEAREMAAILECGALPLKLVAEAPK